MRTRSCSLLPTHRARLWIYKKTAALNNWWADDCASWLNQNEKIEAGNKIDRATCKGELQNKNLKIEEKKDRRRAGADLKLNDSTIAETEAA